MKKLLAVAAIVGPALSLLPATPANADVVCLPITIDGQPVCQDTTPVDQAVAQAEATVADGEGLAIGIVRSVAGPEYDGFWYCDSVKPVSDGVVLTVGTFGPPPTPHASNVIGQCDSYELSIEANAGVGGTSVHIPQVCLTTTGTCVGGIDTTAPTPVASYTVCLRSLTALVADDGNGGTSNTSTYTGTPTCLPAA